MPEVWICTKRALKPLYGDSKGDHKLWNTGQSQADDQ